MSSVSKETAPRSDQSTHSDPDFSDTVGPTDIAPQQASTQPGDGFDVHARNPGENVPVGGNVKVPFKEQVIGVAKKTRGTLLGKPKLKQHGQQILEGKATVQEPAEHTD